MAEPVAWLRNLWFSTAVLSWLSPRPLSRGPFESLPAPVTLTARKAVGGPQVRIRFLIRASRWGAGRLTAAPSATAPAHLEARRYPASSSACRHRIFHHLPGACASPAQRLVASARIEAGRSSSARTRRWREALRAPSSDRAHQRRPRRGVAFAITLFSSGFRRASPRSGQPDAAWREVLLNIPSLPATHQRRKCVEDVVCGVSADG
jgi:hypothetical protein